MRYEIKKCVATCIEPLVHRKYNELAEMTKGIRHSAKDLAYAVSQYPGKLVVPPESAYELLDIIEIEPAEPQAWSIVMPLWTEEEGRSDLSLEMTVIRSGPSGLVAEVDGIHVR